MTEKTHDLHDFMRGLTVQMAAEYERIRKRAPEDPGTAGDQGEANWAEMLRDWLPGGFHVVTKGRIISQDGVTSPQVDVLVLSPAYPKALLGTKLYLAAGVVAVFECKITLKAHHIAEAVATCAKIKAMYLVRTGTPYEELHSPVIFGLLAHSHVWKDKMSPVRRIAGKWKDSQTEFVKHPREEIDVICVSDLATWTANKMAFVGPKDPWYDRSKNFPDGFVWTSLKTNGGWVLVESLIEPPENFVPIGALIAYLAVRLAWEHLDLRSLAAYYRHTKLEVEAPTEGVARMWPASIYSRRVLEVLDGNSLHTNLPWDPWNANFH